MRGHRLLVFALGVTILVITCASTESKPPARSLSELVKELQDRTTNMTEFRQRLPLMITQMAGSYEDASQEMSLEELDSIFVPKQQHKRLATTSGVGLQEYQGVQGRPGVDFPVLPSIPKTSFNCRDMKSSGYYADTETDCQVFHICADGRKISFLCPNGTIFRQSHLICDWWWTVDCASSKEQYEMSAEQLANDQKIYRARADALAQSRARQQGGRKPGLIREYESTQGSTARPRQLTYTSINRGGEQRFQTTATTLSFRSPQPSPAVFTQPPPAPGSQVSSGDFRLFEQTQHQNYQTAQNQQQSPFRSAVGTREDFRQQARPAGSHGEFPEVPVGRQPKKLEQAQPTGRPFQQAAGRQPPPQQQQFSQPPQQTGRPFNNRQPAAPQTAKTSFLSQNIRQTSYRNSQQQSPFKSTGSFEFNGPPNQDRAGGQIAPPGASPRVAPKLPQSQKQANDARGRSYNHYTLFYDAEGERQQPAETGSFVGSRGNQFPSPSKQQLLLPPLAKVAGDPGVEEKVRFVGGEPGVPSANEQDKGSSPEFDSRKNKVPETSKPVLEVAHSRRVQPSAVQVLRSDGAKIPGPKVDVPDKNLQPPGELDNLDNNNSEMLEISEKIPQVIYRQLQPPDEQAVDSKNRSDLVEISEEKHLKEDVSEKNESSQKMRNSELTQHDQNSNEENDKHSEQVGASGVSGNEDTATVRGDSSVTEPGMRTDSEESVDFDSVLVDENVDDIDYGDDSMEIKFLEQPSLFDITNSSATTDVTGPTPIASSDDSAVNDYHDSSLTDESDEDMTSEPRNMSHMKNDNLADTFMGEITTFTGQPTTLTGRSSRKRKPTNSENLKLAESTYTTPSTTTLTRGVNRSRNKPNTESMSRFRKMQSQKSSGINNRTMRARARTSQRATSTEQSIFSSRPSRYRIPSVRIIEVTIRSSSTPSPFRFTLPISHSSEEYSNRDIQDISNIYFPNGESLTKNNNSDEDIISIVSPASPSSRSGRFRTPTTDTPKSTTEAVLPGRVEIHFPEVNSEAVSPGRVEVYFPEANSDDTVPQDSGNNTSVMTGGSRRKERPSTRPGSVIAQDSDTLIPPLLTSENVSNESLSEGVEDMINSEEISASPVVDSEGSTTEYIISEDSVGTQPVEITTSPTTVATTRGSTPLRRNMGRQRITRPDKEPMEVTTPTTEGLDIALSQRVMLNRFEFTAPMGKRNSSTKKEDLRHNITLENVSTKDSNGSMDTMSGGQNDSEDNVELENFSSDNDTEKASVESVTHITSVENINSSEHENVFYNKFGLAEYDAENLKRKLYVHLNSNASHKPDSYINSTSHIVFIEQSLPSEENVTEHSLQNETGTSHGNSPPVRSRNGAIPEGRKSVKYTELQRQRDKVSVSDSRRRYKPTSTTERPARTTKKSVTDDDAFTQVTKSLYTKLTRELLPPKEEPPRDEVSADISLDISNSNKNPVSVSNMTADKNDTENFEMLKMSREGLDIPSSLGPKALHSLSVYFASNSENSSDNSPVRGKLNDTLENETNSSKEVVSSDENETFASTTLPPLLMELSKDSRTRTSTSTKNVPSMSSSTNTSRTTSVTNTMPSRSPENVQVMTRSKSRYQGREERTRKIETAIRELQEDYGGKLSKSENIHHQNEATTNSSSSYFHESDLAKGKTPDLRSLAQVFSQALSAYLDDPDEFRKALSEVQPAEQNEVSSEEETHSTTFSNNIEISSTTVVSTDYPSATKEKDEVLDFSDVTKLPMLKRLPSEHMRDSKRLKADILNTEQSSHTSFNGMKTKETTVFSTNPRNTSENESMRVKSGSDENTGVGTVEMIDPQKVSKEISSKYKTQTTEHEGRNSEGLLSTTDPSTIVQEINNLFSKGDDGYTTPSDQVNYTATTFGTNENDSYFTPTAGGVNDGSLPRYGGFQNNLEFVVTSGSDKQPSKGSRRKSTTTAAPNKESIEPTTYSPSTKYFVNTETLATDLTPPKIGDTPWSEEVKKEEIIDDVLGMFVPEELNNLAEGGGTAPSAAGNEKSDRDAKNLKIASSEEIKSRMPQNSRRRLGGGKVTVNPDAKSQTETVDTGASSSTGSGDPVSSKTNESHVNPDLESLNASHILQNNLTASGSGKIETHVDDSHSRAKTPSVQNIVYSRNVSSSAQSDEETDFGADSDPTSQELPQPDRKSSVIYSDVIGSAPDYSVLRNGKSRSQQHGRNGRQRSRGPAASRPSNRTDPAVTEERRGNETASNSSTSSSTPIPTSGYTSYSNVEITSKSMVSVTPNANRRQSRKFKSTTITTLAKSGRDHSQRGGEDSAITSGVLKDGNHEADEVSVVTATTVTEMISPMMGGDSGRTGKSQASRNNSAEMRHIMAKLAEAMDSPGQDQALEHLRRMLSETKEGQATSQEGLDDDGGGMPRLNATSAAALANIMKSATTNSTVRRLVLLLVNDSLKDNTVQEAQVRLIEAILRLPGQPGSRAQPPARRRPSSSATRRGRKYSTSTTTSTTAAATTGGVEEDPSSTESYEIDDRAVSLLRSLFTLASMWG